MPPKHPRDWDWPGIVFFAALALIVAAAVCVYIAALTHGRPM